MGRADCAGRVVAPYAIDPTRRRPASVVAPRSPHPVQLVRPLLSMRREEVRHVLRAHGLAWREDSSNKDARFTRNRVRNRLLPEIESVSWTTSSTPTRVASTSALRPAGWAASGDVMASSVVLIFLRVSRRTCRGS